MPVNTSTSPDYERRSAEWQLVREAIAGEHALKASSRAREYILPLSGHKDGLSRKYHAFKAGACYFNATGRTFGGLAGLVARKPPAIQAPTKMDAFLTDCDGMGTKIINASRHVVEELLITARVGILTDFPGGDVSGLTARDVEPLDRRPFWRIYPSETIRYPRYARIGSTVQLVSVILQEQIEVKGEDEFERKEDVRYRVLELEVTGETPTGEVTYGSYRQRVFVREKTAGEAGSSDKFVEDTTQMVTPRISGKDLTKIPFQLVDLEKSLLFDLATVNIHHLRNSASHEGGLVIAGSPTPWGAGIDMQRELQKEDGSPVSQEEIDGYLTLGGGRAWMFKNDAAKVELLSLPKEALGAIEAAMEKKEKHMVVLGARIIESEQPEAESGVAKEVDSDRDSSQLATISRAASEVMTAALQDARNWYQLTDDVGVTVNTDFFGRRISPAEVQMIVELWQQRVWARSDVRRELRSGELIPQERTDEMIDAELDLEEPAGGFEVMPEGFSPAGLLALAQRAEAGDEDALAALVAQVRAMAKQQPKPTEAPAE